MTTLQNLKYNQPRGEASYTSLTFKHKTMEKISELYLEYIDDSEGLTPQAWVEQYDLTEEEKEYFLFLMN